MIKVSCTKMVEAHRVSFDRLLGRLIVGFAITVLTDAGAPALGQPAQRSLNQATTSNAAQDAEAELKDRFSRLTPIKTMQLLHRAEETEWSATRSPKDRGLVLRTKANIKRLRPDLMGVVDQYGATADERERIRLLPMVEPGRGQSDEDCIKMLLRLATIYENEGDFVGAITQLSSIRNIRYPLHDRTLDQRIMQLQLKDAQQAQQTHSLHTVNNESSYHLDRQKNASTTTQSARTVMTPPDVQATGISDGGNGTLSRAPATALRQSLRASTPSQTTELEARAQEKRLSITRQEAQLSQIRKSIEENNAFMLHKATEIRRLNSIQSNQERQRLESDPAYAAEVNKRDQEDENSQLFLEHQRDQRLRRQEQEILEELKKLGADVNGATTAK